MSTELEVTKELTVEQKVSAGMATFENKKQELTALAEKNKALKVVDINDKKQLEAVSAARKELKKERVAIENQGAEMRKHVTIISKNISAKEKELVAIIEPIEEALLAEEKRVDAAIQAIKDEAARKEREAFQARVKLLIDNGCTYNGSRYAIGDLSTSEEMVQLMEEAPFMAFVDKVKLRNEAIIAENARIEAERQAEITRVEEARKAEAERVRLETEKLKAEKEAFEKEQAAFRELQAKAREEADAKQRAIDAENLRIANEQREKEAAIAIERERLQKEKEADEAKERARLQQIENERIADENEKLRLERVRVDAIAAENKRIQDEKDAAEVLRLEQAKEAALAPDKVKLKAYSDALSLVLCEPLKDEGAKKIYADALVLITKIQAHISTGIKALTKSEKNTLL